MAREARTPTPSRAQCKFDSAALTAHLDSSASNPAVTSLQLRHSGITPSLAVQIADFVEVNRSITDVDLTGNPIGSHGVVCIASSLHKNGVIQRLSFASCSLPSEAVLPLVEYLKSPSATAGSLTRIDLSDNQIDDDVAEAIGALVENANRHSFELDLRNNWFSDPTLKQIAAAIQPNHGIRSLRLEGIDDEDATIARQQIKFCLQRNKRETERRDLRRQIDAIRVSSATVETCNLDYVDLTLADAKMICDALVANRSITSLRLRDNALLAEGTRCILLALETHPSLRRLELKDTCVSDEDFIAINRLLRHNHRIEELVIQQSLRKEPEATTNGISRETCALLYHTFVHSALGLTSLSLVGCGLGDVEIGVLAAGLAAACRLQECDVHNNSITDHSAGVIVRVVQRCSQLQLLDVGGNKLTWTGITTIANAAQTHSSLRVLRLGRCSSFDRSCIETIVNALRSSVSLVRVELFTKSCASRCAAYIDTLNQSWDSRRSQYRAERQQHDADVQSKRLQDARRRSVVRQVATSTVEGTLSKTTQR